MRPGEWRDVVPQINGLDLRFPAADFVGEVVVRQPGIE